MPRVEVATELDTITCYRTDCGILFAVPVLWMENKRRDHSDFTCPNGHHQAYLAKSKEEELKDELKRARGIAEAERAYAARLDEDKTRLKHQLRAQKGVVTRLRNKAIAGIREALSPEKVAGSRRWRRQQRREGRATPEP